MRDQRSGKLVLVVLALVCALFAWMYFYTPKTVQWQVADGMLDIRRLTGHARFPLNTFDEAAVRVVDFEAEPGFRARGRVNGFDGFGYRCGHFRLANGTEVELDLGNETRAVLIPRKVLPGQRPTRPLLVGAEDPTALLRAIR